MNIVIYDTFYESIFDDICFQLENGEEVSLVGNYKAEQEYWRKLKRKYGDRLIISDVREICGWLREEE